MNRPRLKKYIKPEHIKDYPVGPSFEAGFLTSENSGWRTEKPVVNNSRCTACRQCYLCCPEGVIFKKDEVIDIDYSFCKGCGICARVCPKKAIIMRQEKENE
ncbi:MAG: 4Fe-4S binding protein [Dysgonamonadaceae bacterium]|jgi:pyruvate ferredoxin oxidoreductase delta subunit|nr:4Fe-4S binding protein [Dysgonamonadaceae bacterium]